MPSIVVLNQKGEEAGKLNLSKEAILCVNNMGG